MRTMKYWFFVLASMVAICGTIEAKTATLEKGEGVIDAMKRIGCHHYVGYFLETLRQSHLVETQLQGLSVGTSIIVPDECWNSLPPRTEVKLARQFFTNQVVLQNAGKTLKANATLTSDLNGANTTISKQAVIIATLVAQLLQLQEAVPGIIKANQDQKIWAEKWRIMFFATFAAMLGIVLASTLWITRHFRRLKNNVEILPELREGLSLVVIEPPQEERRATEFFETYDRELQSPRPPVDQYFPTSVVFFGEVIEFVDETKHHRRCKLCGEKGILPEEMEQHLFVNHPELRLRQVSPGEAKRLLRITD